MTNKKKHTRVATSGITSVMYRKQVDILTGRFNFSKAYGCYGHNPSSSLSAWKLVRLSDPSALVQLKDSEQFGFYSDVSWIVLTCRGTNPVSVTGVAGRRGLVDWTRRDEQSRPCHRRLLDQSTDQVACAGIQSWSQI